MGIQLVFLLVHFVVVVIAVRIECTCARVLVRMNECLPKNTTNQFVHFFLYYLSIRNNEKKREIEIMAVYTMNISLGVCMCVCE